MSPRQHNRWLIWLLPLIGLRALVPVGFMVSAGETGIEIMMCSGTGPMPVMSRAAPPELAQHKHHAGHADQGAAVSRHGDQHGQHSGSHENSLCPFAAVGCGSVPVHVPILDGPRLIASQVVSMPSTAEPRSAAVLIERIRGPPSV